MKSEEHSRERMQKLRGFNWLQNSICKGAIADDEKLALNVCTNPRRNGSAWCQKCSDEYHGKASRAYQ